MFPSSSAGGAHNAASTNRISDGHPTNRPSLPLPTSRAARDISQNILEYAVQVRDQILRFHSKPNGYSEEWVEEIFQELKPFQSQNPIKNAEHQNSNLLLAQSLIADLSRCALSHTLVGNCAAAPLVRNSALIESFHNAVSKLAKLENIDAPIKQMMDACRFQEQISRATYQLLASTDSSMPPHAKHFRMGLDLTTQSFTSLSFLYLAAFDFLVANEETPPEKTLVSLHNQMRKEKKDLTRLNALHCLFENVSKLLLVQSDVQTTPEQSLQRQDRILLALEQSLESIRHLAVELSNEYYHLDLKADVSNQTKAKLETAFSASINLLNFAELLTKYLSEYRQDLLAIDKTIRKTKRLPGYKSKQPNDTSNGNSTEQQSVKPQEPSVSSIDTGPDETEISDEAFLKFSGLSIEQDKPLSKTERRMGRMQKLLDEDVLPTLDRIAYDHEHIMLPECTVLALEHEVEKAETWLKLANTMLARDGSDPHMKEALEAKAEQVGKAVTRATQSELQTDLLKLYATPQAGHWMELIEKGEIQSLTRFEILPTDNNHCLLQLGIQAKPTSDDQPCPPVWLHIHMKPKYTQPKKAVLKSTKRTLNQIISNEDSIDCAHLKSNFYKAKGKTWEKLKTLEKNSEVVVKRSAVSTNFLSGLKPYT